MDDLIPLDMLDKNQWADVAEVCGDPKWIVRMAEMGVRQGSRVQVLQPGSPCLIRVGETKLSIRGDIGLQILARPLHLAV